MGEMIRKHNSLTDNLPPEILRQVDRLLIEGNVTYDDIQEYVASKGYDIKRSAIGRYGKNFLAEYREVRMIEDQSRTLVSQEDDSMVLEEAAAKLFSKNIIKGLIAGELDIKEIPRLVSDFAKLQASAVMRERYKKEWTSRAGQVGKRGDHPGVFLDFLKDLVTYLKENDPSALPALENNFDGFVAFAKEKYAVKTDN